MPEYSGNVQAHDIVRHVIAVADVEVSALHFLHSHAVVKFDGSGVVSVDVQAHLAGRGMDAPDVADGLAEQVAADVLSLEAGQHVNLLQVEDARFLRLHGKVAAVFPFVGGDEVHVTFLHLLEQVGGGIHPVHHEFHLVPGKEVPVGGGKSLLCQFVDEHDVVFGGLAECRHGYECYTERLFMKSAASVRRRNFPAMADFFLHVSGPGPYDE